MIIAIFPEPDLPAFNITNEYISNIKNNMPELPWLLQEKYIGIHGLSAYDAAMICIDKDDAGMYETIAAKTDNYKSTANWLTGPIRNYCNERDISIKEFPLDADRISELIAFTETGKIHFNVASSKLMDALIADKKCSACCCNFKPVAGT